MNLSAMKPCKNAAKVRGKGREHLGAFAAHAHKTNSRLRVCTHLDTVYDADSIYLGLPSS